MADDDAWGVSPKQLLDERRLKPRKRFGQNFLTDRKLAARIVALLPAQAHVIEIGAGTGVLTDALSKVARHVTALEIDRDLAALLQDRFAKASRLVRIVTGDALAFDFAGTLDAVPAPRAIIGNLPYYITTPLLERIFDSSASWECTVLMVQREYAHRLVAAPASADYSSLSVFASYFCDVRKMFDVGAAGFYPAPNVSSSVVRLTSTSVNKMPTAFEPLLLRLVRAAFAHRRKTLVNSVLDEIPGENNDNRKTVEAALAQAGIDPKVRAERLALPEFRHLTEALAAAGLSSATFEHEPTRSKRVRNHHSN